MRTVDTRIGSLWCDTFGLQRIVVLRAGEARVGQEEAVLAGLERPLAHAAAEALHVEGALLRAPHELAGRHALPAARARGPALPASAIGILRALIPTIPTGLLLLFI